MPLPWALTLVVNVIECMTALFVALPVYELKEECAEAHDVHSERPPARCCGRSSTPPDLYRWLLGRWRVNCADHTAKVGWQGDQGHEELAMGLIRTVPTLRIQSFLHGTIFTGPFVDHGLENATHDTYRNFKR